MRSISLFAMAMAVAVPSAAFAGPETFPICDGYDAPTKKGDGITTGSFLFGLASTSEDIRREAPHRLGEAGIAACDAALADPLLQAKFTTRRTSLRMARALHLIGAKRPEEALVALDQIDAAAPVGNPLYDRGERVRSLAIRAYALIELGRNDEALSVILRLEQARPYAIGLQSMASRLRWKISPTLDTVLADARRIGPVDPQSILRAMVLALHDNRMAEVVSFGHGYTLELPRARGGWVPGSGAATESDLVLVEADVAGMLAYAMEATGDAAGGGAVIERERGILADFMRPLPPPTPPRTKWSKDELAAYDQRVSAGKKGLATVDGWTAALALRRNAPTLTFTEFLGALGKLPRGQAAQVLGDLLGQLKGLSPQEEDQRAQALKSGAEVRDRERHELMDIDLAKLALVLPRPEVSGNQPKIHKAGDGYFLSDNGYSSKQMDSPDRWTVRFTSLLGTHSSVEEMALFAGANLAKAKGYDHFIVETRRGFERTTRIHSFYGDVTEQNSGREAQMTVRLVRPDALPEDLMGAEWRILDADTVLADIRKEYPETDKR